MLSTFAVDKKMRGRKSVRISGPDEGLRHWMVNPIGTKGVESQRSGASRLSLVQGVGIRNQADLEINKITQHRRCK
jgi:hypothetical protein